MYVRSADEIKRTALREARETYAKEHEIKSNARIEIDWSIENDLHPFTFDIMTMGQNRKMLEMGIRMVEENIE